VELAKSNTKSKTKSTIFASSIENQALASLLRYKKLFAFLKRGLSNEKKKFCRNFDGF
jgi:hypothetical protein